VSDLPPSPRKAYFTSPHHATIALAALGAAVFFTGLPLVGVAGGVAYVLSWVYVPDFGFFRRWMDQKNEEAKRAAAGLELQDFAKQRDALVSELNAERRRRNEAFGQTYATIAPAGDPRVGKLEEMHWTYLRLLSIEQSLDRFLEGERRDDVPTLLELAKDEVKDLENEVAGMKNEHDPLEEGRQRLLDSRRSRLDVLKKRNERIEQAEINLRLSGSELERLEEQMKLLRADAIAAKNAGNLSTRIDSTFDHLAQTNRWLSEMDQFRDLLGALPDGGMRAASSGISQSPQRPQRQTERER